MIEKVDSALTVRETLRALSVLVSDENSVEREHERAVVVESVLDREIQRQGGERSEKIDSDEVDWRHETRQYRLEASSDGVFVDGRRCEFLRDSDQHH